MELNREQRDAVDCDGDVVVHIEVSGGCLAVPAVGSFDAQVRVPGRTLLQLSRVLPSGDPFRIQLDGDSLRIQNCSIPALCGMPGSKSVDLLVNTARGRAEKALSDTPIEDLTKSGLAGGVHFGSLLPIRGVREVSPASWPGELYSNP